MSKNATRDGIVLIEFLLIASLLVMIVFMGAQFGVLMSRLQVTGEGARVAAKDASTKPGALVLPASAAALYIDPGVFDERFTAIDLANLRFPSTGLPLTDQDGDADVDIEDQFRVLPAVHRALRSHMITDSGSVPGRTLVRFTGALLVSGTSYIVRVPDVTGANAPLRRIVNPPLTLPADGLVQMECWQWYGFSVWMIGGAGLPLPLTYSNVPPGYSVLKLDVDLTNPQGLSVNSYAVGRKEIQ